MSEANTPSGITGTRVLVVEDDPLLGLTLKHMLEDLDCVTVGPAESVKEALALAEGTTFDIAILDVNLMGESIHPFARHLHDRKQAFIFSTGMPLHTAHGLFEDIPVLAKPFSLTDLQCALEAALGRQKGPQAATA